jgi:hypothetical protein
MTTLPRPCDLVIWKRTSIAKLEQRNDRENYKQYIMKEPRSRRPNEHPGPVIMKSRAFGSFLPLFEALPVADPSFHCQI